eukprot:TRINITY_DN21332_c0_g1_i2.p1 TRINITY_DN21332_c0_g1~~TRINITY_DN21332_c0_g1_i2.p1  ORF type:complete len:642 (-),score=90.47 TRINITY_DN21332_c0_g1_i2:322-2247(-)
MCRLIKTTGAMVCARDQSSDPVKVRVAGTAKRREAAKQMIKELLAEAEMPFKVGYIVEVPVANIGKIMGPGGAKCRQIQAEIGVKFDFDKSRDPIRVAIRGDPQKVAEAKRVITSLALLNQDENSEYVDLERRHVGAILGVKGARLREINKLSGCAVDLDKSMSHICRVRMSGSPEQIEKAKVLVWAAMNTHMPRGNEDLKQLADCAQSWNSGADSSGDDASWGGSRDSWNSADSGGVLAVPSANANGAWSEQVDEEHVQKKFALYLDQIEMPCRPAVQPSERDCELFFREFPTEPETEEFHALFAFIGKIESVCRTESNNGAYGRGYVRFSRHREAATCLRNMSVATWSERERAASGMEATSSFQGFAKCAYPSSLMEHILGTTLEEKKKKLRETQLRAGVIDLLYNDKNGTFTGLATETELTRLRHILEGLLSEAHGAIQKEVDLLPKPRKLSLFGLTKEQTQEDRLHTVFQDCGRTESVRVLQTTDGLMVDALFETAEDAQHAATQFESTELDGMLLTCRLSNGPEIERPGMPKPKPAFRPGSLRAGATAAAHAAEQAAAAAVEVRERSRTPPRDASLHGATPRIRPHTKPTPKPMPKTGPFQHTKPRPKPVLKAFPLGRGPQPPYGGRRVFPPSRGL